MQQKYKKQTCTELVKEEQRRWGEQGKENSTYTKVSRQNQSRGDKLHEEVNGCPETGATN